MPRTPQRPRPSLGVSRRAGCGHRGWGLRCHRPLPRAGPPRRSRRRGRPVAPRTSAGLTFPAREEQEEEEEEEKEGRWRGRRGKGFVSASRPPSAPALAIPLPQPLGRDGAGESEGGEEGACATGAPSAPGTAHPPLRGRAASALTRGPGTQAAGRRELDQKVDLTQSELGWPGSRPASAPPPGSSHSPRRTGLLFSRLGPVSFLSAHHRAAHTLAPPSRDEPRRPPADPDPPRGLGAPAGEARVGAALCPRFGRAVSPPRGVLLVLAG